MILSENIIVIIAIVLLYYAISTVFGIATFSATNDIHC